VNIIISELRKLGKHVKIEPGTGVHQFRHQVAYMRTSVQLWCKTDVHSQRKPRKTDVHQFSFFYLHCHKKQDILIETVVFYLLHSKRSFFIHVAKYYTEKSEKNLTDVHYTI
jgi:hypothetical protein